MPYATLQPSDEDFLAEESLFSHVSEESKYDEISREQFMSLDPQDRSRYAQQMIQRQNSAQSAAL